MALIVYFRCKATNILPSSAAHSRTVKLRGENGDVETSEAVRPAYQSYKK